MLHAYRHYRQHRNPTNPANSLYSKTPFARAFITLLFKSLKNILKTFFRAREYKLFNLKV
nr:MAG TPA: hypothetical protein [Caudoviricetes sp.]